jgi:hypothetical protein
MATPNGMFIRMSADRVCGLNKGAHAAIVSILLVASLLYFNGLTPSFSSDDDIHLDKNINFNPWQEAGCVFFHLDGREYRPLVRLSLWLNHQMGKTALPFQLPSPSLP